MRFVQMDIDVEWRECIYLDLVDAIWRDIEVSQELTYVGFLNFFRSLFICSTDYLLQKIV